MAAEKDNKGGRPTAYNAAIAEEILARMADGESLRSICKDEKMPSDSTIRLWAAMDRGPGFSAQYARAREMAADAYFDEAIEIADDGSKDMKLVEGKDGTPFEVVDHDHINRSRLRVDTRKWAAGKLAPKKYGDRITTELTGKVQTENTTPKAVRDKARDELGEIFGPAVAAALAKSTAAKPRGNNRVVRAKPHKGGRKKR